MEKKRCYFPIFFAYFPRRQTKSLFLLIYFLVLFFFTHVFIFAFRLIFPDIFLSFPSYPFILFPPLLSSFLTHSSSSLTLSLPHIVASWCVFSSSSSPSFLSFTISPTVKSLFRSIVASYQLSSLLDIFIYFSISRDLLHFLTLSASLSLSHFHAFLLTATAFLSLVLSSSLPLRFPAFSFAPSYPHSLSIRSLTLSPIRSFTHVHALTQTQSSAVPLLTLPVPVIHSPIHSSNPLLSPPQPFIHVIGPTFTPLNHLPAQPCPPPSPSAPSPPSRRGQDGSTLSFGFRGQSHHHASGRAAAHRSGSPGRCAPWPLPLD